MKVLPQRTCIGCNEKKNKKDLIRIVKKDDNITLDKTGKAEGRGAYICDNIECLKKAIKSKRLDKSFKMKIDDSIYEKLENLISK